MSKSKKPIQLSNDRNIHLRTTVPSHQEQLVHIGKAISSPVRLQILNLLDNTPMSIQEIASTLDIPVSSTAMHIRCLEEARMVVTESQPGLRGSMRVCINSVESIRIDVSMPEADRRSKSITFDMPVGNYYDFEVAPTCGLADKNGVIDTYDNPRAFYSPLRTNAQLLWFHKGFIEYRFPNFPPPVPLKELTFSLELCSEAPGFAEDWPSDITFTVNGRDILTYQSPGDFGARRGSLTPENWKSGSTQYGLLKTVSVRPNGGYLDGKLKNPDITLEALNLPSQPYISFAVSVRETAKFVGGVNLFGREFGDYSQGIVMSMFY